MGPTDYLELPYYYDGVCPLPLIERLLLILFCYDIAIELSINLLLSLPPIFISGAETLFSKYY